MTARNVRELVELLHRQAAQASTPLPPLERPGIPYKELEPAKPDDAFYHEWNTYLREIERLLAEGHEGRSILIKGQDIIGIFDTWEEAREAGVRLYLLEPFFVHVIRSVEPVLRLRGYNLPCRG